MKTTNDHEGTSAENGANASERPLPKRIDRKRGAALITHLYFPISPRTLEKWPICWRHANGRATCETVELLNLAKAKLDAAPPIQGGRRLAEIGALGAVATQSQP